MLFTEGRFFVWLAASLLIFWSAPRAWRPGVLLLLSALFWLISSAQGTVWLMVSGSVTWVGIRGMSRSTEEKHRLFWLRASAGLVVGILLLAKFGARLSPELRPWLEGAGSLGGLPLGISYYSFHCLGCLLDVYWSKDPPPTAAGLGLYLSFFPKAVMGPIARSGPFQREMNSLPSLEWKSSEVGPACFQISAGLFMKFVLADRIMLFVNGYHDSAEVRATVPGVLAAVMFCWQLYYDFFGYSLIAVGTGRLFGFKLPNNFNRPFFVHSISDFWSRWHISLSGWFQEYFYTPLRFRFRRHRTRALVIAGMVTFISIGIWHGTGWTFVILGVIHGLLVTAEALFPSLRERPQTPLMVLLRTGFTFLLIASTLVLFRAPDLGAAGEVYSRFFHWDGGSASASLGLLSKFDWLLTLVLAGVVEVLTARCLISGDGEDCAWISQLGDWARAGVISLLLSLTWCLGMFGKTTFLYNQF